MRKRTRFITLLYGFLLLFIVSINPAQTDEIINIVLPDLYKTIIATDDILEKSNLNIHYIDVGQADSILITLNDSAMLIDAGNNTDGKDVVDYITAQNITKLDYVIGTHPHEDHIGGLDNVIKNFKIGKLIMPKVQTNTKTFEDVLDATKKKKLSVTTPKVGTKYTLSDAEFTILSCKNETVEELNLSSIVIKLVFGENSFIFCGDAETPNESEMLASGYDLKANVIKLGHHGSSTSSSEKFLKAVDPDVAIISVGKDNDYGHPHSKIVKRLNRLGIKAYRTDLSGTIILSSDGKNIDIKLQKGE